MPNLDQIANSIDQLLKQQPNKVQLAEYRDVFGKIAAAVDQLIGHKLFTLTVIHPTEAEVVRLYSSKEGDYALEDRKPILDTPWTEQVIAKMQPFSASNIDELKPIFPDYQKISDMGLGAAINLPVCWQGKCIGTMNLLNKEGLYQQPELKQILNCAQLVAPVFAAYRQLNCAEQASGA
ncbi:MAG: hypothetical protein OFPII_22690 [Osedax symbiont Rs1]|nr:MAG: hypothetical protein OFPII_22690 [Osedax symbiont Rs1]